MKTQNEPFQETDRQMAEILREQAPRLYQAIELLVQAGEPKRSILRAVKGWAGGDSCLYGLAQHAVVALHHDRTAR